MPHMGNLGSALHVRGLRLLPMLLVGPCARVCTWVYVCTRICVRVHVGGLIPCKKHFVGTFSASDSPSSGRRPPVLRFRASQGKVGKG